MKKITLVSVFSFVFLLACSLVARFTEALFSSYIPPLIIGASLLLVSGIIALIIRENNAVNIFCFSLSAISCGFLIRAWYILRNLQNSIGIMVIISLVCVLYLWIIFAIIRIPVIRKKPKLSGILIAFCMLLSIIVYIILIIRTRTTFLSTLGYYMFIEFSFIFAMSLEAGSKEELIRNLTLSSYSVLAVAIIVVIFALMAASGDGDCDCDCGDGGCDICDGCDCADDMSEFRQKRKQKRKK